MQLKAAVHTIIIHQPHLLSCMDVGCQYAYYTVASHLAITQDNSLIKALPEGLQHAAQSLPCVLLPHTQLHTHKQIHPLDKLKGKH